MENLQIAIERIEKILKEKNKTINKMLIDLDINKDLIRHMKDGKMPSADKFIKIANYLNVSSSYLIGFTDNLNPVNIDSDKTSSSYPNELLDSIKLRTDSPVAAYESNGIEHISKVTDNDLNKMIKKENKKIMFPLDLNGNIKNVELTEQEYKVLNSTLRGLRGLI